MEKSISTPAPAYTSHSEKNMHIDPAKAVAKKMISRADKLKMLRELASQQKTKEEIMQEMNISESIFSKLYFDLVQMDKQVYQIASSAPLRKTKVGKNGILISPDKIQRLGLASAFREGMELHFKKDGEKIIISTAPENTRDTSNTSGGLYLPDSQGELEESLSTGASVNVQNTITAETEE